MKLQLLESSRCFDGMQNVYSHHSTSTESPMRFAIFLPPAAEHSKVPVLYWLSGLTCTEQNFITKAGAQRVAAALGIAIVAPDTSPRALADIPQALMSESIGEGAGFYVDAVMEPWSKHYKMYTYVSEELPNLIAHNFPVNAERAGIFGHSMGGHGALITGLRNPEKFKSLSAFAPICAPSRTPWGTNVFQQYLGKDSHLWQEYDATELVKNHPWPHGEILFDQGSTDPYLANQLQPELFVNACKNANVALNFRMQENYNHNYYFVSTFIEDHLRFHQHNLVNNY